MITEIRPDDYFEPIESEAQSFLEEDILTTYPYPLAVSYQNVLETTDPLAQLGVFLKDQVCTLYQYIALLMLHDYANQNIERDYRVFTALEMMVYRPGPGKWLGFLREVREHYGNQNCYPHIRELFDFLDQHYSKNGTKLTLYDGENKTRLSTLDALVTLRNRWAHSKHLRHEQAEKLCRTLLLVMQHLYKDLASLKEHPLLLQIDANELVPLSGADTPDVKTVSQEGLEVYLGTPDGQHPLMKLFLYKQNESKQPELFLFEELVKEKQTLFSSSFSSAKFRRSKDNERPVVECILDTVERVRTESETLTLDRTTFENFAGRCNTFSEQIYSDFKESGKYRPGLFMPQETVNGTLREFLASESSVYILSGEQGGGKSAHACQWVRELLGLDDTEKFSSDEPAAVFFLEAHRANTYQQGDQVLERCITDSLQLDPQESPVDFLEKACAKASRGSRVVFVLDALNEFQTMKSREGYVTKINFFNEILEFVKACRQKESLRDRFKLIVTLRWDMFRNEGWSPEEFEEEQATHNRENWFYHPDPDGRLFVELPPFSESGKLYESIRHAGIEMSPLVSWDDLPHGIQDLCGNPMLMQLFMRTYDGCDYSKLDVKSKKQLENRFVKELFMNERGDSREVREDKQDRTNLVLKILKQMKKEKTTHLLLNPAKEEKDNNFSELMKNIQDKTRITTQKQARCDPYQDLIARNVLREDMVRAESEDTCQTVPIKRMSFAHDIINKLLLTQSKKIESKRLKSFLTKALLPILLLAILLSVTSAALGEWGRFALFASFGIMVIPLLLEVVPRLVTVDTGTALTDRIFGESEIISTYDKTAVAETSSRAEIRIAIYGFVFLLFACAVAAIRGGFNINGPNDIKIMLIVSWGISGFGVLVPLLFFTQHVECAILGRSLLRSNTYGREFISTFLGGAFHYFVLVTALVVLHGLIFVAEFLGNKVARFTNEDAISFYNNIAHIPLFKFPDCLIWPWFLLLLPLWLPILGLPLLWWGKHKSTVRSNWPQQPDVFRKKAYRISRIIGGILLPVCALLPVALYPATNCLDFGELDLYLPPRYFEFSEDQKITRVWLGRRGEKPGQPKPFPEVKTIASLSECRALKKLYLIRTDVKSLEPIKGLPKLERVTLWENPKLHDLSALGTLPKLEMVELRGESIKNIDFFSKIKNAEDLDISLINTSVTDISPLRNLEEIQILSIKNSPLKKLTALPDRIDYQLSLNNVPISDISALKNVGGLIGLSILNTNVNDLSPIKDCDSLVNVTLKNNEIKDFSPLLEVSSLGTLEISSVPNNQSHILKKLRAKDVNVEVEEE